MPAKIFSLQKLPEFLPEHAIAYVSALLVNNPITIILSRPRSTKMADFRVMQNKSKPEITINNNLNKYEFLITLLHEYAHFLHWQKFSFSRKPHGKRWKNHFRDLLLPILSPDVFPQDVLVPLISFFNKPLASGNTHVALTKALQKYSVFNGLVPLTDLQEHELFSISAGKVFQKGQMQRKRYKCLCKNNGKIYFVNASIMVMPFSA